MPLFYDKGDWHERDNRMGRTHYGGARLPERTSGGETAHGAEGHPVLDEGGHGAVLCGRAGFVAGLKEMGYRVFLDLKLHDIPNTVKGGAVSIARLGVDMFNAHAGGGKAMLAAAREGPSRVRRGASRPLVIGVTQLTSTSVATMNEEIASERGSAVLRYAQLTQEAGLDGVVASAQEVVAIKADRVPASSPSPRPFDRRAPPYSTKRAS